MPSPITESGGTASSASSAASSEYGSSDIGRGQRATALWVTNKARTPSRGLNQLVERKVSP